MEKIRCMAGFESKLLANTDFLKTTEILRGFFNSKKKTYNLYSQAFFILK